MSDPLTDDARRPPEGVLALSVLASAVASAFIANLAVGESAREVYASMGINLPALLKLGLSSNLPLVCGVLGGGAAFAAYLVASDRVPQGTPARAIRGATTLVACGLLLWSVATYEAMQGAFSGLRVALAQAPLDAPAPVAGEVQALAREVVDSVQEGVGAAEGGAWTFAGPGEVVVKLPLPSGPEGNSDRSSEVHALSPGGHGGSEREDFPEAHPAPETKSGLSYAFRLSRGRLDSTPDPATPPDGVLGPGDPFCSSVYRLKVFVFRGKTARGHYRVATFETVVRGSAGPAASPKESQ